MHKRMIKLVKSKKIYVGKSWSLRLDKFRFNDRIIEKEIVEHLPSVGMIPILDNENILLVSQYRIAARKNLLEIPAVKIEQGETPRQAALREMAEEIGYAGTLVPLLKIYLAPGYDTELMYIYVAKDLKKIKRRRRDDDEIITIKKIKISTAIEKCISGQVEDSKSITAILTYATIKSINK
ncbi:MAG: NUDIX hydrolase [Candidatus Nitrosopolaris sp.]